MQIQKLNQATTQKVASGTLFLEQNFAQKNKISLQPMTNLTQDYTVGAKVNTTEALE